MISPLCARALKPKSGPRVWPIGQIHVEGALEPLPRRGFVHQATPSGRICPSKPIELYSETIPCTIVGYRPIKTDKTACLYCIFLVPSSMSIDPLICEGIV